MSAATADPTPYAQAAGHLVLAGWWPLPLPARSKKSPPEGYTGGAGRAPSPDDVNTWLRTQAAGNVAVRLPPDVVGIDVDAYGDKPGADTLAQLEAEHGPLPATVVVTSRHDGASGIRLFRLPDGVDQATFRTGWPGIEILRHGHRYVVAPPSIHPDTGEPYRCFDPASGEVLPTLPAKADLPMLPESWAAACAKPERPAPAPRPPIDVGPAPVDAYAPCKAMSAALADVLERFGSGAARHDVATAGALRLTRLADMGHHGGTYALDVLGRTLVNAITDRLPRGEAVREWEGIRTSAADRVAETPTPEADKGCCGADSAAARSLVASDRWLAELERVAPTPEAIAAEVEELGAGDVDDLADRIAEAKRHFVEERLPILDWHALWADESEEEWIVEPLLPARRLVALYSAPKVGKSLLLLELAAAIAAGNRFVLGTVLGPSRTVLYVDFENDPKADVRERLTAMGYGPDDLGHLRYLSFPTIAGLDSERGAEELMAAVEYHAAEVVVIDTVSRAVAGEENENDTWLSFYRHTGLKLKQAGVALIRLDHSGKDEAKGQRGGSAKVGDVDAVWRMSRVTETVYRLDCEANRMPVTEKSLTLTRLEDPDLRHKVEADAGKARRVAGEAEAAAAIGGLRVPDDVLTERKLAAFLREQGIVVPRTSQRAWLDVEKRRRGLAATPPEAS